MIKKILTWAGVIFVVYYLTTQPAGAGTLVHHVLTWLQHAGNQLATFANSL